MGWFKKFMRAISFGGDPIGNALGLKGWGDVVSGQFWNLSKDIKADWQLIKHWLVADMRRDREVMTNNATTPRRIVYGRCRVSGQIAYMESAGDKNQYLHLVVILAGHPVSGFGAVYLDDKPLADFGTKASIEFFDGSQTTACANLVAASLARALRDYVPQYTPIVYDYTRPIYDINENLIGYEILSGGELINPAPTEGLWTENHKLLGCAYAHLTLEYDETLFPTGLPVIKVVVDGKAVLDPRTGITAWSDNAALCSYDYMRLSETFGGMGCDDDEISTDHIIAAANVCDQLVVKNSAGTEYEKRYTCNGSLEVNGTPKQLLAALLQAMGGTPIYSEGLWKIYPAAYLAPEHTIDESWLNGGITFRLGSSKGERFNTITGTFVDPDDHWAIKGFPAVTSSVYIADDGGEELAQDLVLNFTTSPTMAQRLAKIIIERSRRGLQIDYPCNFKALRTVSHEVAQINNTLLGWSGLVMRIGEWELSPLGGVKLALSQESPDIYSWVPGDVVEMPPVPITNLPDPWDIGAPTNLEVYEELYTTNVRSVIKTRVTIFWEPTDARSSEYEIRINGVYHGRTLDVFYVVDDMTPAEYTFSVRAKNAIGATSQWVDIGVSILGKYAPPEPPTVVTATIEQNLVRIAIAYSDDVDLSSCQIRQGSSWDLGAEINVIPYPQNVLLWQPNVSGTLQFWAKSIDTSGIISTSATGSSPVTITAPLFPPTAVITYQIVNNNVLLQWPKAGGTYPIDVYEIRKGLEFSSATVVGTVKGTFAAIFEIAAGTYKYWVVGKDSAGLYGTPISVYVSVAQPPNFVLHDQRPLTWSGTKTNCLVDTTGALVIPVNTVETIAEHFINNAWDQPADQVSAGYPAFIQPGMATGEYQEIIDYGASIPGTKITLDLTRVVVSGTVTITPTLSISSDNVTWIDYPGVYSTYATAFRYCKVTLEVSSADGGVIAITGSSLRLDVTQVTHEFKVACVATDAGGTVVDITGLFIDVQGVKITPRGTAPLVAVADWVDEPNPTEVKILLFSDMVGTRADGDVTVTITGV
jgi:hypothetical protein